MLNKFLRRHFVLNRRERAGLFALILLIAFTVLLILAVPVIVAPGDHDHECFEEGTVDPMKKEHLPGPEMEDEVFYFDPNLIGPDEWRKLGIPDHVIRTIGNYLKANGRFRSPGDLMKIYGFRHGDYRRIAPYIKISPPEENNEEPVPVEHSHVEHPSAEVKENVPAFSARFEINGSDSVALTRIYGIGPVLASRIVRYRNLLGGFHDREQLLEVYGIDRERLDMITDQIEVDTCRLVRISINRADFRTLLRHPYLDEYQVRAIMAYKDFRGEIKDPRELATNHILTKEQFNRLGKYLMP